MAYLTISQILRWDPASIDKVFEVHRTQAGTFNDFADNMRGVQNSLADWGGETAKAFHEEMDRIRKDIEADGRESAAVAAAIQHAEQDVVGVKNDLTDALNRAHAANLDVSDDGTVTPTDQEVADSIRAVMARADSVDEEIATALRAGVGDVQLDSNGIPVLGQELYRNGAHPTVGQDPNLPVTLTPGRNSLGHPVASDTIPLRDDPPGYPLATGAQRNQNWLRYLNGYDSSTAETKRAEGTFPAALPRPEAVSDPALRVVGAAAAQQGVSYAWGGNKSPDGPTRGTLQYDVDGGATRNHDDQRTGFDCGGLARYAVEQGYGTDIGAGTSNQFTHLGGPKASLTDPQPGDLAYYGANGANHVAINIGNGVMIEAYESGVPIEVLTLATTNQAEGQQPVWVRPH